MSDYQKEEFHSRDAAHAKDPVFTHAELCELWEAIQLHCDRHESHLDPDSTAPKAAETAWAKLEEWVSLNVDPEVPELHADGAP